MNIPRLGARRVVGWTTAGVLAVAGLTGAGVAFAGSSLTNTASSAPSASASPTAAPPQGDKPDHHGAAGRHGRLGRIAQRALHGEFVSKEADGKIVTRVVQHGQVTAVSGTSITLKSDDGFTGTYAVNGDTKVHVGRDSAAISGVKTGGEAWIVAVKGTDASTATHLVVKAS